MTLAGIVGISAPHSSRNHAASLCKKVQTGEFASIMNRQADNNAQTQPSSITPAASSGIPVTSSAPPVPEGFEELASRVERQKQEIEEIMREAREVTGFNGRLSMGRTEPFYNVGPYTKYDEESRTWQWYNEDGTPSDGMPSHEETVEQIRVSAEKRDAHKQFLLDNGVYEKMEQLSQDAMALDLAGKNEMFRNDYLENPDNAMEKHSWVLEAGMSKFNYIESPGGGDHFWHGSVPVIQGFTRIPGEIERIDLYEILREAHARSGNGGQYSKFVQESLRWLR